MASILFKWFLIASMSMPHKGKEIHPFFVSVIEIEHNSTASTLEMSCKIFTDDFEKTLRQAYKSPVDLVNPKDKDAMGKLVNAYVQKHFRINVDGKNVVMRFIGYEIIEEGVNSYFEAEKVNTVKTVNIFDNILYEYKKEQVSLIHITVNGNRKSTRLINPEANATFSF